MTEPLFKESTVYGTGPTSRTYALGGVLQTLRAGRGWSVEQAAVHAGMGHMTWRRLEDGFSVRNKTYAGIDGLFELPFGTVKRALADDLLMVQLIGRVGVDTSEVTTASAGEFVERFAKQTLSRAAQQVVQARATASLGGLLAQVAGQARPVVGELAASLPTPTAQLRATSDIEATAQLLDRLSRRHQTPKVEAAVQALLAAMPDLVERPD